MYKRQVQGDPSQGAGTLIFDEVDAGIGGAVGDTVGALMKQLGRQRQVLAVTHLAQVAACARRSTRSAARSASWSTCRGRKSASASLPPAR